MFPGIGAQLIDETSQWMEVLARPSYTQTETETRGKKTISKTHAPGVRNAESRYRL